MLFFFKITIYELLTIPVLHVPWLKVSVRTAGGTQFYEFDFTSAIYGLDWSGSISWWIGFEWVSKTQTHVQLWYRTAWNRRLAVNQAYCIDESQIFYITESQTNPQEWWQDSAGREFQTNYWTNQPYYFRFRFNQPNNRLLGGRGLQRSAANMIKFHVIKKN